MKRLALGLTASVLLHGVLLQVAMGEPKNQFKINVNSGKMSMAIKPKAPTKNQTRSEEQKTVNKPEPEPQPKPEPDPKPKKKKEREKKETNEAKQDNNQKDKQKPTPASQKRKGAEWVKKADYRTNPSPAYPHRSRRLGEEGTVILKVQVNEKGQPNSVEIKQSSGHKRLDQAAVETVRTWEFTPASTAGIPVRSTVLVPVKFRLDES